MKNSKHCAHPNLADDAKPWPEIPTAYSIGCADCKSHVVRILQNGGFREPRSGELIELMDKHKKGEK